MEGRSIGNPERVKLADVARAAGVSTTVVSQALAGDGVGRIAPGTRERVRQLAQEMGYHPSARARSLKLGRAGAARCAVVSFGRDAQSLSRVPFFGATLAGIAARAASENMDVHLEVVPDGPAAAETAAPGADPLGVSSPSASAVASALSRLVAADRADGCIILSTQHLDPRDVAPLARAGIPFVLVNRHFGDVPVNCVISDKVSANRAAAQRLAALGHRRMALLLPSGETSNVSDHRLGWLTGLRDCGLDEVDAPVLRYGLALDEVEFQVIPRLLSTGLPGGRGVPTAIVAFDDDVASVALRAAARAGVRVPGQLSVLGHTNILAPFTTPALCSHEHHPFDAGAAAAGLLALLLRGEASEPRRVVFPSEFICRESCGPAPT